LPPALAVALVALFVLVVGVSVPTRVTVGADGVFPHWLGTVSLLPWSRVRAAWLTLRMPADGERYQPERDAMVERMRAAARAYGDSVPGDPGATARLLGRSGGATREWVRAVRSVVSPL